MEKVCILYGHLEYITAIWYILWPFVNLRNFGTYYGHLLIRGNLVYLPPFW
jgi:hypothetical protein